MTTDRTTKCVLIGGFVLLTAAVVVARGAPADGYEVSIYRATPPAYWICVGGALLTAVAAGFAARGRVARGAAAVLGGASALSIAGLPLVRAYYYYGEPDAMTHLGWTRELQSRVTQPTDLIYPGVHLDGVMVQSLLGIGTPRALMLVVLGFALLFLVAATLAIRSLVSTEAGLIAGAASACLFLPINNIAIELTPHPISQSAFFFAFVVLLALRYIVPAVGRRANGAGLTGQGILLALTSLAVVLYHPQLAVVVLVLYGAISVVQWYFRRAGIAPFTDHRPLYGQTLVLAVAIVVWIGLHDVLVQQLQYVGDTIVETMLGRGEVGTVVQQRSSSLTAVGSGPVEIFLKLFLASAVYVALTALFLVSGVVDRFRSVAWGDDAVATYMLFGSLGIALFSGVQFVGDFSRLVFRYQGIMMVVATVLGGAELVSRLDGRRWSLRRVAVATVLVTILLSLSLVTLYPSPYTYQPSAHKTEASMKGYAAAFAHDRPDAAYSGLGYNAWRYHDAVVLTEGGEGGEPDRSRYRMNGILDPRVIRTNLTDAFPDGRYVPVTDADRGRELDAVDGIQYSQSDFDRLDTTPGVDRVQSSGSMHLYYVRGAENGTT